MFFYMRVPEEINQIVDHTSVSILHIASCSRLSLREGLSDQVIKTGSPMKEVLDHYSEEISHKYPLN